MPVSLLQPLGILVSLPILETLRHLYAISYGPPVPDYKQLGKNDILLTLTFAICCFSIIVALGGHNTEETTRIRPGRRALKPIIRGSPRDKGYRVGDLYTRKHLMDQKGIPNKTVHQWRSSKVVGGLQDECASRTRPVR
jgi:hypothetical protein